jgi:beta-glucanase (GH16 family)
MNVFTIKRIVLINVIALTTVGCGGGGGKSNKPPISSSIASSVALSSSVSSTSSASSSALSSAGSLTKWELTWSDEFSGTAIDNTKWSFEKNCAGGGNNELQCYTDRLDNASVSDGKLHIIAKKETFSGQAKFDDDPDYNSADVSVNREYTSARLRTKNKGDWKYGRMEINAKLPQGQGIWPAIWMLPTEWKYGSWPRSGEIDIMEAINSNTGTHGNKVYGTLHFGDTWPNNKNIGASTSPATNIWDAFHTYAIEWEEGEIRWYVDDVHFATQTKDGWFNYYWDGQEKGFKVGTGAAPFDQLFHLILNVAVGGAWPGNPNNATTFPQQMDVDYVRVYQCTLNPDTGKGCASHVNPTVTPLIGEPKPTPKVFSLFNNGASNVFDFTLGDETVHNVSNPAIYDGGTTGNVVSNPQSINGDQISWDLDFTNAPGNAFLNSILLAPSTKADNGLKFSNMQTSGELKFDLLVESIDSSTKLLIKLDSGWPNLSYKEITTPIVGEWTSVSVPFDQLLPNNIQPGQMDMEKIVNTFVIEPSGGKAHVKVNNIRIQCILDCAIKPILKGISPVLSTSFDIFVDDVDINWDFGLGVWDTAGGSYVTTQVVDATEIERGKVIDVTFGATDNNGLAFIQSTGTKDVTAFASTGNLTFDIKVLSYGANTSGIVIKADCVNPCSSGEIPIGVVGNGSWQTITIPISQMVTGGLNLSKVNTPFIVMPTWGAQKDVHLQLDNIRWVKP